MTAFTGKQMSSKPKLLVTRKLTDDVEARISENYDAVVNQDDRVMDQDELVALAEGCEGILMTSTEPHGADLIARLPDSEGSSSLTSIVFSAPVIKPISLR